MVYDVTRRDSFEHLTEWLKEVQLYTPNNGENVVKVLVGNKVDLPDRQISRGEAEQWARSQGMLFLEASAKTRAGIKQCFVEAVQKILQDPDLLLNTAPGQRSTQNVTLKNAAGRAKPNMSTGGTYDDDTSRGYGTCC
jgi:Ras-related protein Rab-18